MKRLLMLLLFVTALAGPGGGVAAVVPDLYQVRVPVNGQSSEALAGAARVGLAELMVRISGDGDAMREPGLQSALDNAERYVEQYRFDRNRATPDEPQPAPWSAILQFAQEPVDTLLRSAGLSVWGANRPVVMVWLAKDEPGGRVIINENSHPELVAALRAQARRRGVLLRFPLLDLDDLAAISADDVWRLDGLALVAASERYQADAVLGGRATELSDGRWLGSWRLAMDGKRIAIDAEGATREAYVERGVGAVAGALADRYAVAVGADANAQVRLRISGIAGFSDYGRVLQYLNQLSPVRDVNLLQADGEQLVIELQTEGRVDHLERALALDNLLLPSGDASSSTSDPADSPAAGYQSLDYRWQRPRS